MSAAARDDALSCPLLRNIRSGSCIACICRGIEGSVHGKKMHPQQKVRHSPGTFILFAALILPWQDEGKMTAVYKSHRAQAVQFPVFLHQGLCSGKEQNSISSPCHAAATEAIMQDIQG